MRISPQENDATSRLQYKPDQYHRVYTILRTLSHPSKQLLLVKKLLSDTFDTSQHAPFHSRTVLQSVCQECK